MKQLPSVSHQSLLFDYVSFCRSINVNIMKSIISVGSSSASNRLFLQQEFYNLFMKKCSELKYLDMRSIEHQIFNFPEAKLRFESLYELKCDTSIDSSYFYGLAHISQYIQKIIVVNNAKTKANFGVVKLIEVQKNLKYFELIDEFYTYSSSIYYVPDKKKAANSIDPILLALEKKADIINHLKIYLVYIGQTLHKVLPKLYKLKTLIVNDFRYTNEEQLRMCVYHDLEILKIDYCNLKTASIIIENSGGHLKKILLGTYEPDHIDDFYDDSLTFIRKIYQYCPSIEYLPLAFSPSKEHFEEFEKLLNVCQNLKSLSLIMCDMEEQVTEKNLSENGEELLKIIIKSAPTNLREIRFLYDFKFSLGTFEEFLVKWRGRPSLSILTYKPIFREENYVKLINKYKNNGVIKDFRCESFINVVKYGLSCEYYMLPHLL
ncbi:hypothetical protein GLOIN_2v1771472 [Rhizophagus irregularis DAOM 181602=DAOM 197198]|nr:hypothetical protein GLOIN_2v1771472 [Rhizophagus irregularis DAOM 181602=DAOM 197198]CAG8565725.1 12487_t:CDS:1 [Rhizophagus irregularis]